MSPVTPKDACWTSFVGAPTHSLGELPERCYTCAAKQRENMCIRCHINPRHRTGAGCADCLNEYMDTYPDGGPGLAAWARVAHARDNSVGMG